MSEEEKKAIETLKQPTDFSLRYYERENAIDTILNLIEKQEKVIDILIKELAGEAYEKDEEVLAKIKEEYFRKVEKDG